MTVAVWTLDDLTVEARKRIDTTDKTEVQWVDDLLQLATKAHARGDGVAVYVNQDLGHPDIGQWQVVSYGSEASQLETRNSPAGRAEAEPLRYFKHEDDVLWTTLPDIGGRINWRYQLEAIVPDPSRRPVGEAFNDPRVPCCERDAADCDCPPTEGHLVLVQVRVSPLVRAEHAVLLVRAAVENGIDIWTTSGGECGFTDEDAHIGQDALEASVNLDLIDVEVVEG